MNSYLKTHEVLNQPTALRDYNSFTSDQALQQVLRHFTGAWGEAKATELGEILGRSDWIQKGFEVNHITPELHSHDSYGRRLDVVHYHPAYHQLMALAFAYEIPTLPWKKSKTGNHVVRMALNYLYNQNEAGSACPLTMTFACIPSIQHNQAIAQHWLPKILNNQYDPSNRPLTEKMAATVG